MITRRAVYYARRGKFRQWKVRGYMASKWEVSGEDTKGRLNEFKRVGDEEGLEVGVYSLGERYGGFLVDNSQVKPGWRWINVERAKALKGQEVG
ncbi:hypothetical protein BKA67DRAFT_144448 [Truncatella angustata]|uniref:Uncharacterized protein n=1 Tax=Truncatella angustata TaxID=152316 RepID=A0A9P8RE36_9PEZI|nr:uncharacterized protein BKA67DRAFT_144448 [Truncatella angustata]KAH6638576.1 hypothetical protein BKA67DRAFT_144448 [Truncatella angustata]